MTEIIAIDGPASVGKTTLAKKISIKYNSPILYSGRLYRSLASKMIQENISLNDEESILDCIKSIELEDTKVNNLYERKIDLLSSKISKKEYVRRSLKKLQRRFPKNNAKNSRFAIIEGRDIGTVIFPNAKYKFFLWADAKIRARRRLLQIKKNGRNVSFERIFKEISLRDKMDIERKIAPLRPAVNSVLLDTSYLDIEQALNLINNTLRKKTNGPRINK